MATIAVATVNDAPAIRALAASLGPWQADVVALPDERFAQGDILEATEAGELVGYALLRGLGDRLLIQNLAIAPGSRLQGIGSELFAWIAALPGEWKALAGRVPANDPAAVSFYENAGCERVGAFNEGQPIESIAFEWRR